MPGDVPAVCYTQALLAIASQHCILGGLGELATTSILGDRAGRGITWRFGRGAGGNEKRLPMIARLPDAGGANSPDAVRP